MLMFTCRVVHLDNHSGQDDYAIYALTPAGKPLGYLKFSVYQEKAKVGWLLVHEDYRRQGVGLALLMKLNQLHPGFAPGYCTNDGYALYQAFDRKRAGEGQCPSPTG
jgi:GNAT superfamily N-acetyltransferase